MGLGLGPGFRRWLAFAVVGVRLIERLIARLRVFVDLPVAKWVLQLEPGSVSQREIASKPYCATLLNSTDVCLKPHATEISSQLTCLPSIGGGIRLSMRPIMNAESVRDCFAFVSGANFISQNLDILRGKTIDLCSFRYPSQITAQPGVAKGMRLTRH